MRRFVWMMALPVLGGCFMLPSGEKSRAVEVPPELRRPRLVVPPVQDHHFFGDVRRVAPGQWATYREDGRTVTVAAVAKDPEGIWIEVIEEGEPRLVSARLVTPEGAVLRAFYREISKEGPSAVVPQPLAQWTPPAPREERVVSRRKGEERFRAGDRDLVCVAERGRREDLEGRLHEEVTLWHPDVPRVYRGGASGGLVRLVSRGRRVELVDFGTDAQPHLEPPE